MMADQPYDLIVIGAGPGGYVGALRAAQLGLRTAIVERDHLGGICLNWGCIPTKALLHTAQVYRSLQHAGELGLVVEPPRVDFEAVIARSRQVSTRLNAGVRTLLEKNGVDLIWGQARLAAPGEVLVTAPAHGAAPPRGARGPGRYRAAHVLIATGARALTLPGVPVDGERVWTYAHALAPARLPRSLLIVGAGAIGVEFASFYATLATQVTLVEQQAQILPAEDAEIATIAARAYADAGIRILTSASVRAVEVSGAQITATIEVRGQAPLRVTADHLLCAIGVTGNTEGLGLEDCGVPLRRGTIVTDAYGHTEVPGLHAVGDVAGAPMLAHKAAHEAITCVEHIAGHDVPPVSRELIPACTYALPQVAHVGLTEQQARQQGWDVRVGRFPFAANGKAIAVAETQGLVKTVFDRATGRLLGAHMVGAEVTELIHGYVVAMNLETDNEALAQTVFAHPTLSEMLHESALAAAGRPLHIA
jgi:dihydrolipoamide dehydrogenase